MAKFSGLRISLLRSRVKVSTETSHRQPVDSIDLVHELRSENSNGTHIASMRIPSASCFQVIEAVNRQYRKLLAQRGVRDRGFLLEDRKEWEPILDPMIRIEQAHDYRWEAEREGTFLSNLSAFGFPIVSGNHVFGQSFAQRRHYRVNGSETNLTS